MDEMVDSSNMRGPKTLEEKLIEDILLEVKEVRPATANVRAVVLVLAGAKSPTFDYVDKGLKRVESYLEKSTQLFQRLDDLMAQTSIVGQLSPYEKRRRLIILIEWVGMEEVLKIIEQLRDEKPPDNVIVMSEYKANKEKKRILGITNQPKGAA